MDDIRITQPLASTSSEGPVTSISVALGSTQLSQDTLVINLVSSGPCRACGGVGGDSSTVDLSLLADAIVQRLRQRSVNPRESIGPACSLAFPASVWPLPFLNRKVFQRSLRLKAGKKYAVKRGASRWGLQLVVSFLAKLNGTLYSV